MDGVVCAKAGGRLFRSGLGMGNGVEAEACSGIGKGLGCCCGGAGGGGGAAAGVGGGAGEGAVYGLDGGMDGNWKCALAMPVCPLGWLAYGGFI